MVRRWIVLAAVGGMAMGVLARPAAAQYGGGKMGMGMGMAPKPWAITAGWMWNSASTPVNNEMIAGIQYAIASMGMMGNQPHHQWVISADWLRVDSESIVGIPATRRRVSLVPVLLTHKHHFTSTWYGMIGAGVRWSDKDVPEMRISNRVDFAWQLGLGYDLGTSWFVEGRYLAGTHPGDDGLWGGQVGYRF